MSYSQWLNAIGIVLEMFAVFWVFYKFPSTYEDELRKADLHEFGGDEPKTLFEMKTDLYILQGSVGLGLLFELIATFL